MTNKKWKCGLKKERLHGVWLGMRNRCFNAKGQDYKYYGGRGISVCEEWNSYQSFREWAYSSGYDENAPYGECTLDRINPDGNYEPSNCRWITIQEQQRNKHPLDMSRLEKPVEQLDSDGHVVCSYRSINAASRATGVHSPCITNVCKGNRKSAGGYGWRYKCENSK